MARNRINPGQRLDTAISARAWNRAQDAADVILGDRGTFAADGQNASRSQTTIIVRNDSGFAVPMLGVLSLTSPVISPAGGDLDADAEADARAKEFFRSPVLIGVTPTANSPRFGIALEPIANNALGRVIVSGATPCKIKTIAGGPFFYAATRDADRTQLILSSCGPARVLWHEGGSPGDDKWALVVL